MDIKHSFKINHMENTQETLVTEKNTLQAIPQLDNDTAKKIALMVSGKIPYIGGALSEFIDIFWPTTEVSLWDQIKDQVETMVNQKISEYNLKQLELTLQGVRLSVSTYPTITDPRQKLSALVAIEKNIETVLPKFLSGEPASNFSCFWGIALLHMTIRRELCDIVKNSNDHANEQLLKKYATLYCSYARTCLSRIYNDRISQIEVLASSDNEPGKHSNWRIDVTMTDKKTGAMLYEFHKHYRGKEWNNKVLDDQTIASNNEISKKWDELVSLIQKDISDWGFDAVKLLEKEYPFTHATGLAGLKTAMTLDDYKTYEDKYYPSSSIYNDPETTKPKQQTATKPVVQLNPFKKGIE
jgi:hypothetical protein